MTFFDNIQALRAYAVFSVVVYHLFIPHRILAPGAYGVDVFFVISVFIMAHLAVAAPDYFLLRRVIRIVPWARSACLPSRWPCPIFLNPPPPISAT